MSERMTGINLPGVESSGLQDWGLKTAPEMIRQIRSWAKRNKAIADAILSADDDDFRIETYLGPWARRDKKVIQKGREK